MPYVVDFVNVEVVLCLCFTWNVKSLKMSVKFLGKVVAAGAEPAHRLLYVTLSNTQQTRLEPHHGTPETVNTTTSNTFQQPPLVCKHV
jgi:hypothetical protein